MKLSMHVPTASSSESSTTMSDVIGWGGGKEKVPHVASKRVELLFTRTFATYIKIPPYGTELFSPGITHPAHH